LQGDKEGRKSTNGGKMGKKGRERGGGWAPCEKNAGHRGTPKRIARKKLLRGRKRG